jgi:pyruvate, orthophosphate dikinase
LLSLDGNTGAVHHGRITPVIERLEKALAAIAAWRGVAVQRDYDHLGKVPLAMYR